MERHILCHEAADDVDMARLRGKNRGTEPRIVLPEEARLGMDLDMADADGAPVLLATAAAQEKRALDEGEIGSRRWAEVADIPTERKPLVRGVRADADRGRQEAGEGGL
jgi:hypothetical protein